MGPLCGEETVTGTIRPEQTDSSKQPVQSVRASEFLGGRPSGDGSAAALTSPRGLTVSCTKPKQHQNTESAEASSAAFMSAKP